MLASGAKRVTDAMLMSASRALAASSPLAINGEGALLPPLEDIQQVSRQIAKMVGKTAQLQGQALQVSDAALDAAIEANFWHPEYRKYRRISF